MVIGIVGLVMVDIEERWVVVMVRGSRWRWGEGGQHWSCMGWTCLLFIGSSCSIGVSEWDSGSDNRNRCRGVLFQRE